MSSSQLQNAAPPGYALPGFEVKTLDFPEHCPCPWISMTGIACSG
jgi:hypothetical protein